MKQRRVQLIVGGAIVLALLAAIAYQGVDQTVSFYSPGEVLAQPDALRSKTIRIMAMVEPKTTQWDPRAVRLSFRITEDSRHFIPVEFRGVKFHKPVPPGTQTADVEVFNNTQNAGSIQVTTRMIVLQPNGSTLLVGEEYTIQNQTHPPVAYYRDDGTLSFSIPDGAQLNQVSVSGPGGMPVVQGTIDKGKNTSAIAYAFRPGESTVRLSYEMPYPSNEATIHTVSPYASDRVLIVVPPPTQVLSAGFQPAGNEQGYNVYARDHVPAGAALDLAVSGAGSVPRSGGAGGAGAEASEAQNPSVNSRAGEATEESSQVLPGRLEDVKWILVGGFAALFALGVVFLWKKPQQVAAAPAPNFKPEPKHAPERATLSDVDREVRYSLDELKENLFRL
jgi:cytochrome c-type biogenesis protein CcmE